MLFRSLDGLACRRKTGCVDFNGVHYDAVKDSSCNGALAKLNRHANEMPDLIAQSVPESSSFGTARGENVTNGGFAGRKSFKMNQAPVAQLDRASAF